MAQAAVVAAQAISRESRVTAARAAFTAAVVAAASIVELELAHKAS